ncbi:hypothetical protein B0H13DRAFT_1853895 [Mycena leptocephala]|nr:hypothetical protein B0H13DRAFT_1853895 [Mycena leptocephala]
MSSSPSSTKSINNATIRKNAATWQPKCQKADAPQWAKQAKPWFHNSVGIPAQAPARTRHPARKLAKDNAKKTGTEKKPDRNIGPSSRSQAVPLKLRIERDADPASAEIVKNIGWDVISRLLDLAEKTDSCEAQVGAKPYATSRYGSSFGQLVASRISRRRKLKLSRGSLDMLQPLCYNARLVWALTTNHSCSDIEVTDATLPGPGLLFSAEANLTKSAVFSEFTID